MEIFSILFAIIWMFVIISIIASVAKGASKGNKTQQQLRQRAQMSQQGMSSQRPQTYDAQQANLDRLRRLEQRPAASRASSSYRAPAAQDVKTSSLLFEDRKGDWLAQQLREEEMVKKRGMLADLGAMHEVECAADMLKQDHVRRHNTTGLNKRTFR